MRRHIQHEIADKLTNEQTLSLIAAMDPDEAVDILQMLGVARQKTLLEELSSSAKEELGRLLKFDPETAGGLMTLDYIQVVKDQTIAETAKKFKLHEQRTGHLPTVLVLDGGRVVGYLPGHEFGFAKPSDKVHKYIKNIKTIRYDADYGEIVRMFRSNPHSKLIVLDESDNALGIIYSDDMLTLLKEKENETLYDFAGIRDEEDILDPARIKIRFRYKWLVINLATAFLAAFVVSLFDETINKNVLLAVYMPIVAGMGGNAATQTLAVTVRGITMRQITFQNFTRPLMAEISSGFVNGLLNGVLVFTVVMVINKDIAIASILGIAMIVNLVLAAFFGTIIPLVMKSLGKDPASSATIFITTATDVLGFLVFLGLATLVLN
jgi:magnesium transporter